MDLDETLLDGSGLQQSIDATCAMVAEALPHLNVDQIRQSNARAWRTYWSEVELGWELGLVTGAAVTLEAWRRTLSDCESSDDSLAMRAADYHRGLIARSFRLFDDVQAFVDAARAAHLPLVLVTNGASDTQREKLEALDIAGWFDATVISGEVGAAKPDPSVFSFALERLGLEADSTWHVGDSLSRDVAGAAKAGMTAVWLNRGGIPHPQTGHLPHVEVSSLSDLISWIRR